MPVAGVPMWVVSYLKGGARKTTTAVFLAFSLARRGVDVLLLDADHGTQGVADWATKIHTGGEDLPFHVVQWSPRMGLLVPFITNQVKETGTQHVVVDVGGEAPETLRQLVMAADRVISPAGAEEGELSRMSATAAIVAGTGVPMSVLLTRVPLLGAGSARDARRDLVNDGFTVFDTEIEQNKDRYAHVWGTVPEDMGAYDQLLTELLTMENGA